MHTAPGSPALLTGPVVEDSPQLMQAWCTDMAQKIHEYPVIAERYGFEDDQAMFDYLATRPTLRRRIRELRATWESDDNVETRVRRLAGHTVLEALPSTGAIMFNDALNPTVRIDALKAHARLAGIDALPVAAGANAGMGGGGGRFSVQIIFGSTGQVETITTVDKPAKEPAPEPLTIEGEAS